MSAAPLPFSGIGAGHGPWPPEHVNLRVLPTTNTSGATWEAPMPPQYGKLTGGL